MLPLELVPPELTQWLPAKIVGVVTAMMAAAWAWRSLLGPLTKRIRAAMRRIETFLDDWDGEPARPGVPARPGMVERVRGIEDLVPGWTAALSEGQAAAEAHTEAIADIRKHVQPNGGTSAYDALTEKIVGLGGRMGGLEQAQLAVAGTVDGLRDDLGRLREENEEIRLSIDHMRNPLEES